MIQSLQMILDSSPKLAFRNENIFTFVPRQNIGLPEFVKCFAGSATFESRFEL